MTFWSHKKNGLIRKIGLVSKFMTLERAIQAIAIHILPNISRSKGNQTMNFGQLTEYNSGNISLKKSCTKYGGETVPRTFSKNQNWAYSWIDVLKFYTACFYCMPSWGLSKYIEIKLQITCFYLIWSFSKNQKDVWN